MTETESKVLDLAIQWIDARYAVEEALINQEFKQQIRLLKKERRDAKVAAAKDLPDEESN